MYFGILLTLFQLISLAIEIKQPTITDAGRLAFIQTRYHDSGYADKSKSTWIFTFKK